MILRSLRVSGWRCFAEPWTLGPLGEGLNLVHAPNGSGKSTLFEALRRGLLEAHTLKAEELRPWGRRLAPRVEVEFLQDGVAYRGTKQFLDAPYLSGGSGWNRAGSSPWPRGRRGTGSSWICSAGPPAGGLPRRSGGGSTRSSGPPRAPFPWNRWGRGRAERLKAALGAEAEGPEVRRLREALEARYREHFTPTGRLKTGAQGAPLTRLQEDRAAQEGRVRALQGDVARYDELVARLDALAAEREVLEERLRGADQRRQDLEARAEVFREKVARRDRSRLAEEEVRRHLDALTREERLLREDRRALEAVAEALDALTREEPERVQVLSAAEARSGQARTRREGIRERLRETGVREEAAAREASFAEARERLAERNKRLREARGLEEELGALRQAPEDPLPQPEEMGRLRRLLARRGELEALREALKVRLDLTPERSGRVEVRTGDPGGFLDLEAGRTASLSGCPEVDLFWEGVGTLRVRGPEGDRQALEAERADLEEELRSFRDRFGTQDPEGPGGPPGGPKAAQAGGAGPGDPAGGDPGIVLLRGSAGRGPDASGGPGGPEGGVLPGGPGPVGPSGAERGVSAGGGGPSGGGGPGGPGSSGGGTWGAGGPDGPAGASDSSGGEGERTRTAGGAAGGGCRRGPAPWRVWRRTARRRPGVFWGIGRMREALDRDLEALGPDPQEALVQVRWEVEALRRSREDLTRREAGDRALLEREVGIGSYVLLGEAEELLEDLRRREGREERRTRGLKLLKETLEGCLARAKEEVHALAGDRLEETWRRLAPGPSGRLRMDPEGTVTGFCPEAMDRRVPLEGNLSGGEREQAHLAARVSLARALAREERQLLVLDDALALTDRGRHRRVLDLLRERRRTCRS